MHRKNHRGVRELCSGRMGFLAPEFAERVRWARGGRRLRPPVQLCLHHHRHAQVQIMTTLTQFSPFSLKKGKKELNQIIHMVPDDSFDVFSTTTLQ